jgi:hypothetical protein
VKKNILLILFISIPLNAQIIKTSIFDTNQVSTIFDNRSGLGDYPLGLLWPKGAPRFCYVRPSGLLIGGEAISPQGDTLHIVNDGFNNPTYGDFEPGTTNPWGWLAMPGYDNPDSLKIALSNDTTTWLPSWQAWPGKYGSGLLLADLETYWVMNDSSNAEFNYYPFAADSSFRGLGLEVSCRGYQWDRPEFEDFIIFTYDITNVSDSHLSKLVVGFFSDPIIGGYNDYDDDYCAFYFAEDLVVCYDADGMTGFGIPIGRLGFLVLDSPDKLGLTSAVSVLGEVNNRPKNDSLMWVFMTPGTDSIHSQDCDYVICCASGYFSLNVGETKSYAIALVLGNNLEFFNNIAEARNAYDLITKIDINDSSLTLGIFRLRYNYPNPFNPSTTIEFDLPKTSEVSLKVYNILGEEVATLVSDRLSTGSYSYDWDASSLASGVYLYRLQAADYVETRKMVLMR